MTSLQFASRLVPLVGWFWPVGRMLDTYVLTQQLFKIEHTVLHAPLSIQSESKTYQYCH